MQAHNLVHDLFGGKIWASLKFFFIIMGVAGVAGAIVYLLTPPIYVRFYNRAVKYEQKQLWDKAIVEYEKAASEAAIAGAGAEDAKDVETKSLKAAGDINTLKLSKLNDGLKDYFKLAERHPASEHGKYAQIRLVEMLTQFAQNCVLAAPFIKRYAKSFPKDQHTPALLREGIRCSMTNGRLNDAQADALEFLTNYPNDALYMDVTLDLANAYFMAERYDEAEKTLDPMIKNENIPKDAWTAAFVLYGRCALEKGLTEKAIEIFKKAVSVSAKPQIAQVYLNAAKEAFARKDEQKKMRQNTDVYIDHHKKRRGKR